MESRIDLRRKGTKSVLALDQRISILPPFFRTIEKLDIDDWLSVIAQLFK
jgi:hypothetical protein